MIKPKRVKTPAVHVVLDTNAIFTEAADRLISDSISNFILHDTKGLGLEISWYLPEIVRMERHNQMLERGIGLLTPLGKLEKLLGHSLAMNAEILEERVIAAIDRQLKLHDLKGVAVNYSKVEWEDLVARAVTKQPPFSAGPSEKGFKDALVLEGYLQLANSLPRSPKTCRIALLTGDNILKQAANQRASSLANSVVMTDLNELKTFLNSIAAHLDQDDLATIIDKATSLFFVPGQDSLFYKWSVGSQIRSELGNIIFQPPDTGFTVSTKRTLISPPTFIKKEGQKVYFQSMITYELEAEKSVLDPNQVNHGFLGSKSTLMELMTPKEPTYRPITGDKPSALGDAIKKLEVGNVGIQNLGMGNLFGGSADKYVTIRKSGVYIVEVNWSSTLNQRGNLVTPDLNGLRAASGVWNDQ